MAKPRCDGDNGWEQQNKGGGPIGSRSWSRKAGLLVIYGHDGLAFDVDRRVTGQGHNSRGTKSLGMKLTYGRSEQGGSEEGDAKGSLVSESMRRW